MGSRENAPPPNFCIKGSFLLSLCKALLNMSCLHTMMHGIRLACKFEVNLNGTINPWPWFSCRTLSVTKKTFSIHRQPIPYSFVTGVLHVSLWCFLKLTDIIIRPASYLWPWPGFLFNKKKPHCYLGFWESSGCLQVVWHQRCKVLVLKIVDSDLQGIWFLLGCKTLAVDQHTVNIKPVFNISGFSSSSLHFAKALLWQLL